VGRLIAVALFDGFRGALFGGAFQHFWLLAAAGFFFTHDLTPVELMMLSFILHS
jgi:hypothetical protein